MERYDSLTQILTRARDLDREIRFINGEKDEVILPYRTVWDRALRLLAALQAQGMVDSETAFEMLANHKATIQLGSCGCAEAGGGRFFNSYLSSPLCS